RVRQLPRGRYARGIDFQTSRAFPPFVRWGRGGVSPRQSLPPARSARHEIHTCPPRCTRVVVGARTAVSGRYVSLSRLTHTSLARRESARLKVEKVHLRCRVAH